MPLPPREIAARCAAVRLIVLDVDGVLTDGVIAIDDLGVETKHFHVRDGSAIALWRKAGHRAAILSGRRAACVDRRAAELGIAPVIQAAADKIVPFRALLAESGFTREQTCYMGDDLADLAVLAEAGLSACPSDAADEVLAIADLVASKPGGRGAVREVIEIILKNQDTWDALIANSRPPG